MKKFKNIGYVPNRNDLGIHDGFATKVYKGLGFRYVRFDYENPEAYGNGDTLLDVSWQTYEPDDAPSYWPFAKAEVTTDAYGIEQLNLGVSILQFLIKQYGYHIEQDILRYLPGRQAIRDVKHAIGKEKHYGSEPLLKLVEPEVLVYVAHQRMGIERVVNDPRQHSYVTVDNVLPDNVSMWQAKIGEYPNDTFLAQGLATDAYEAQKVLFNILSEEVEKLRNGEQLTWVYKRNDKEKLEQWFTQWVEQDSPVSRTTALVPDNHSIHGLLARDLEFVKV